MGGSAQLLVYTDDDDVLAEHINVIKIKGGFEVPVRGKGV